MGEGLDVRVEGGGEDVDADQLRGELERMVAKWSPVLDFFTKDAAFHPFSLRRMALRGWKHLPKLIGSADDELKASFSSRAVRAAFSGALLFNGVPPEKMPVTMVLGLVSMLRDGYYLPEGGMGAITETLRDAFIQNGGEIMPECTRRADYREGWAGDRRGGGRGGFYRRPGRAIHRQRHGDHPVAVGRRRMRQPGMRAQGAQGAAFTPLFRAATGACPTPSLRPATSWMSCPSWRSRISCFPKAGRRATG